MLERVPRGTFSGSGLWLLMNNTLNVLSQLNSSGFAVLNGRGFLRFLKLSASGDLRGLGLAGLGMGNGLGLGRC